MFAEQYHRYSLDSPLPRSPRSSHRRKDSSYLRRVEEAERRLIAELEQIRSIEDSCKTKKDPRLTVEGRQEAERRLIAAVEGVKDCNRWLAEEDKTCEDLLLRKRHLELLYDGLPPLLPLLQDDTKGTTDTSQDGSAYPPPFILAPASRDESEGILPDRRRSDSVASTVPPHIIGFEDTSDDEDDDDDLDSIWEEESAQEKTTQPL